MAKVLPLTEAMRRHSVTEADLLALVREGKLRLWAFAGRRFLDPRQAAVLFGNPKPPQDSECPPQ